MTRRYRLTRKSLVIQDADDMNADVDLEDDQEIVGADLQYADGGPGSGGGFGTYYLVLTINEPAP